jgi:hypothetical protein
MYLHSTVVVGGQNSVGPGAKQNMKESNGIIDQYPPAV